MCQRTPLWAPNGLWRTSKYGDIRNLKLPFPENLLKTILLPIHLPAPICSSLKHDNRQLPMHKLPGQEKTQIQETLNTHSRKLHKSGVGTMVKHAEIIRKEESTGLWDKGVMGANSPSSQLNAVFSGSGGEEHRNLKLSQLEWCYSPKQLQGLLYSSVVLVQGFQPLRRS